MSALHPHKAPETGLRGLKQNWRNDLLAGFSVSMVALPLSMGIALASNAPAMAGLWAALIAGFVTTFLRGSHIAINGPGNGLIAVVLVGMATLDDGTGKTFSYILAATVIAGAIQVALGLLRLGKFGEMFPSPVIHGILAAIGLIIMGKQIHVSLGASSSSKTILGVLADIPKSVMALNPAVLLIAAVSLLVLVIYPRLQNKLIHLVPAPMWVLLLAIPLASYFAFGTKHSYSFLGNVYELGPKYLVQLDGNLWQSFMLPNFSKIWTLPFWTVVFSITLISSIETLISAKAIDKLDPYKRSTDANKELFGVGISSVVAGMIGGLPVVTVIARSSVNVHNHAKTRWSNFFQSAFLLVFVVLLVPVIKMVPMAALAAILVYTGYKLTAPRVFIDAARKGWEQLLFLLVTLGATLVFGLVWGLVIGSGFKLLFHLIRLGIAPSRFVQAVWKPSMKSHTMESGDIQLNLGGILNFANLLQLQTKLEELPRQKRVMIDFSNTKLVDLTMLEYVTNFVEKYNLDGGHCEVVGLDELQASSSYPQSMRVAGPRLDEIGESKFHLSRRQRELKGLAESNGWSFQYELNWDASYLKNFQFFETRPLEYKENVLSGVYESHNAAWEISDLTFDEGALLVDEHHTTTLVLHTPEALPEFVVEREELYDRLMEAMGYEDIDFRFFTKLSKKFVVKGKNDEYEDLKGVFSSKLVHFLETHDVYHLESNGEALLVFRNFRLERPQGIMDMHAFSQELLDAMFVSASTQQNQEPAADTSGEVA